MFLFAEDWTLCVLTTIAWSLIFYFLLWSVELPTAVPKLLKFMVPISFTAPALCILVDVSQKAYLEQGISPQQILWRLGTIMLTGILTMICAEFLRRYFKRQIELGKPRDG